MTDGAGLRVRRRPDLCIEFVDDEMIVWDDHNQVFSRLNATASAVLSSCDEWNSPAELVERLTKITGVSRADASRVVDQCLSDFEDHALVMVERTND